MKIAVALISAFAFAAGAQAQMKPTAPGQQIQEATKAATSTPPPAMAAGDSCEAKAVDKNGKPLAGAAKASSIKKCEADSKGASASCEAKAMDKNGKPLAGAAKTSFMKKCEADAKG